MPATPSPNYNDKQLLANDLTFQSRVKQSLCGACVAIASESPTAVVFHRERATYAAAVLNAPDNYKVLFANTVANDALCIGDATTNGTTALTAGNVSTQQALVTDPHMDSAVSGGFNAFFRTPSS